ncbi:hypothetical protein HMPREF9144_1873 [Prevotella pallens ATCC 700821]|uniref:Uncharacterized protein n=1 Tax=Prevotella pallens ATCC 700821 TaxID=997353 RepID=F9DJN2_9BACT|nr:hypothetical protein HMPREF9144_1873 [Prevotella pallens ATCC 700821]
MSLYCWFHFLIHNVRKNAAKFVIRFEHLSYRIYQYANEWNGTKVLL